MGCRNPSQRPVEHIDLLLRSRGAAIYCKRSMCAHLYKPLDAASEVVVEVLQQRLPSLKGIAGDLHWRRADPFSAESFCSWVS